MSRSNPTVNNPCERWFKWEGGEEKGYLTWYDKETDTNNVVEPPFTFLVLDQLNTVTGYDNDAKVGFYANEVKNIKKDILTVRTKSGIEASGTWEKVKGQNKNFEFTKSVYIAFYDENKVLRLGNIKFKGSGLSGLTDDAIQANYQEAKIQAGIEAKERKVDVSTVSLNAYSTAFLKQIGWINFSNSRKDLDKIAVVWHDKIADKNGKTNFWRPVFSAKTSISAETNNAAIQLDKELQEYLKTYFANNEIAMAATATDDDETESYIDQRNKEFAQYDKPEEPQTFSASAGSPSDDDIPF